MKKRSASGYITLFMPNYCKHAKLLLWGSLQRRVWLTSELSILHQRQSRENILTLHPSTEEHISIPTPTANTLRGYSVSSTGGRCKTEEGKGKQNGWPDGSKCKHMLDCSLLCVYVCAVERVWVCHSSFKHLLSLRAAHFPST